MDVQLPGHEGHNHELPFDAELFAQIMQQVQDAKIINNLFLVPLGNPPRFVLAQVDEDGTITTLGYIPFDFMLDVGIGFISAVRNAVRAGMGAMGPDAPPTNGDDRPLAGGLFKVI